MTKVLVTGGSGFLGRHLIPYLKDYDVHLFSRMLQGKNCHPIDLFDRQKVDKWMDFFKPEILIHLAWETTPGSFWHAKENLVWVENSLHLLEAFCRNGGRRTLSCGTCYEHQILKASTEERNARGTRYEQRTETTTYGESKKNFFTRAARFLEQKKVPFAWGRVFYPFGPFEKKERLIPSLISALIDQKPFYLKSATHVRDFIFIEDVAHAFYTLLEKEAEGCFDIGSGFGHSIGEASHLIEELLGTKNLIHDLLELPTSSNPEKLVADPSLLEQKTGWKPKYSLRQGIEKTIQWWQNALCH